MHTYEQTASGEIIPRFDVNLKEARDQGYFASVTTKLKLPSNDYLDGWRHKQAVLTAEKMPRRPNEDDASYCDRVNQILWGIRTRWDGVEFNSNDFGTAIHAELEKWNVNPDYQFAPEWEMYCREWPETYRQYCRSVDGAELMVACPLLMVAGTIDLLANDTDNRLALLDFKARPHGGDPKTKVRDKDCQQLAIEADIIRRQRGLDYFPNCYSVIICSDTEKP